MCKFNGKMFVKTNVRKIRVNVLIKLIKFMLFIKFVAGVKHNFHVFHVG